MEEQNVSRVNREQKCSLTAQSSLSSIGISLMCNEGADGKQELQEVRSDIPSLHVGESSRSLFERSREHWKQWESKDERSHMLKHVEMEHKGADRPDFIMRAVSYHRSALTRQVGEAVR